jgi:serine/threonine protein kinase
MAETLIIKEVIRHIARGSNGEVSLVRLANGTLAACKTPHEGYMEEFDFLEIDGYKRFSHPNIVRLFGVGPNYEMLMEFVDGCDGTALDYGEQTLSDSKLLKATRGWACGLSHMHEMDWCHNDIFHANVAVTKEGVGKIIDLGSISEATERCKRQDANDLYTVISNISSRAMARNIMADFFPEECVAGLRYTD